MAYYTTGNVTLTPPSHIHTGAGVGGSSYPTYSISASGAGGGYSTVPVTGAITGSTSYSMGAGINNIATWTSQINPVNINNNGITLPTGADIKIGDVSLKDAINKIHDRLAILVPDPAKLEKYEALKQAYEHYKTLEALVEGDETK